MKSKLWMRLILVALCFLVLLSLASCSADMEMGNNTPLGEQFLSCVLKSDFDSAYAMVQETVGEEDFREYWASILPITKDAASYELEQIGWNVNTSNSLTTLTTAYQVYFDNGKTALLRIVTRDDIGGIAGLHFSDITSFIEVTHKVLPPVRIVLTAFSLLSVAFVIWMFIDCLRRKMKRKVLWAILVFFGVTFTLTVGETAGLRFMIGVMLQGSSIVADPALLSVITKLTFPVGALIYFLMRKKLTLPPVDETLAAENPQAAPAFDESREQKPFAETEQNQ